MYIFDVIGSGYQTKCQRLETLHSSCQGEWQEVEDEQGDSHSGKDRLCCNFQ